LVIQIKISPPIITKISTIAIKISPTTIKISATATKISPAIKI